MFSEARHLEIVKTDGQPAPKIRRSASLTALVNGIQKMPDPSLCLNTLRADVVFFRYAFLVREKGKNQ